MGKIVNFEKIPKEEIVQRYEHYFNARNDTIVTELNELDISDSNGILGLSEHRYTNLGSY